MKYLITGAAGFIGSNLSVHLSKSGHEVVGIDNYSPYYAPDFKHLRINQLLDPLGIKLYEIDLINLDQIKEVISKVVPDFVIHLAAQPGVRTPLGKSYQYIQNNLVGFGNVLQATVEAEVPNFLYASSSSVYGNSSNIPYREDDSSIKPISIYGATKYSNEIITPAFVQASKTKARGMRFFTVYGPWGRPDMAYFRIINSAINNEKFTKFGAGEIKRDFTYISDITNSIELLAQNLDGQDVGFSDVVNIGGGNPHSLNDLIAVIQDQLGANLDIELTESNRNDTKYTCADVQLLESLTHSHPNVNLRDGVARTIEWAKSPGVVGQLSSWISSTN